MDWMGSTTGLAVFAGIFGGLVALVLVLVGVSKTAGTPFGADGWEMSARVVSLLAKFASLGFTFALVLNVIRWAKHV